MRKELETEMGAIMHELNRRVPFTNAAAVRQAMGEPLPGNVGGDCAFQCRQLIEDLKVLPGEARMHRALSGFEWGRKGKPGSHVLLVKETEQGDYAFDPTFLHLDPFHLQSTGAILPTHNGLYNFFTHPRDQIIATGLENAAKPFSIYVIRFFTEKGLAQMTYDHGKTGEVFWAESDESDHRILRLDGVREETLRRHVDQCLKEFNMDLSTVMEFLLDTPDLQHAYRHACD